MNGRAKTGGLILWAILIAVLLGGILASMHGVSAGPADCPAGPYC